MRALALLCFFIVLYTIGRIRGREVTYVEQIAWVGGIFVGALILRSFGIV